MEKEFKHSGRKYPLGALNPKDNPKTKKGGDGEECKEKEKEDKNKNIDAIIKMTGMAVWSVLMGLLFLYNGWICRSIEKTIACEVSVIGGWILLIMGVIIFIFIGIGLIVVACESSK